MFLLYITAPSMKLELTIRNLLKAGTFNVKQLTSTLPELSTLLLICSDNDTIMRRKPFCYIFHHF